MVPQLCCLCWARDGSSLTGGCFNGSILEWSLLGGALFENIRSIVSGRNGAIQDVWARFPVQYLPEKSGGAGEGVDEGREQKRQGGK